MTDPGMTRYFMTIPEAVSLVLRAALEGMGGELFVLDMGEPVSILRLAEKLIADSGKEISIEYTGLRPGEKLTEALLTQKEAVRAEQRRRMLAVRPDAPDRLVLSDAMEELAIAAELDEPEVQREAIFRAVKALGGAADPA